MIYHKQKLLRFLERKTPPAAAATTFPTTLPTTFPTQDLDAWRIGRTEVVGRQEQGLAGEKRPNDPRGRPEVGI